MRLTSILFVVSLAGCAAANSQVATCQAEKDQLLATIRQQRDSNRALTEQVASLESRLDQAEKALAQGTSPPRYSKATEKPADPPTRNVASLSWRAPEGAGTAKPEISTTASPADLQKLAKQDRRVRYDAKSAAARIDLPLTFRDNSPALAAEDKLQLDEISRLLKSDPARDLKIVVAAQEPDRAKAVADYLDSHGIARDRLAISSATGATSASQVQLELHAPGEAVVNRQSAAHRR
jgi:outer membrane protein OmpA-like peptidoglycan-associated protein